MDKKIGPGFRTEAIQKINEKHKGNDAETQANRSLESANNKTSLTMLNATAEKQILPLLSASMASDLRRGIGARVNHLTKTYSIRDLLLRWDEETDEPELQTILAQAIIDGELKITDPMIENAVLDTKEEQEEFLQKHSEYAVFYFYKGGEAIFNSTFFHAFRELIEYGAASTVPTHILYRALTKLCVKKHDFLIWLQKTDRSHPSFWFSANERAQNPTSKMRKMLASAKARREDPEYQAEFGKRMEEIEARKDVPVLLHNWFKHDTWKRQEGLMLLAGLSPRTLFVTEESMYGEELRRVRFLETLDEFERDPASGWAYEHRVSFYESLWDSGDHPARATPKYFIEWALSKKMGPSWLQWAVDNGYYSSDSVEINKEKEISGKSETAYLHIIGALCDLYWREKYPSNPKINQSEIISTLETMYNGFSGISESNLKRKLPSALKAIRPE
ncbi:MAG: hypothetical protein JWQ21_1450 [Herminiimonas sp.]|nr:hypothetical protein [Herminiimonas sp.]